MAEEIINNLKKIGIDVTSCKDEQTKEEFLKLIDSLSNTLRKERKNIVII